MATLEEEYKQYQGGNYDNINSMYDAQRQATLSSLEQAYNQNLSNAEAARDAQNKQYQARANDLSTQYERNRRNLNQQAAANGLNTGAGSQMQLALNGNYGRDYGNIRTAQQHAMDTANRGIADLQSAYQNSVQQAIADNDYKRAQALLNEYQNQYSKQLQQAQTLASYGDFSAYLNIPGYSQDQVNAMRNAWIAQNPDMAYRTGQLSADDYRRMTGSYPAGYQPTGTPGTTGPNGNQNSDALSAFDTNGDGVLSDAERAAAAQQGPFGGPVSNWIWSNLLGTPYTIGAAPSAGANPAANANPSTNSTPSTFRDPMRAISPNGQPTAQQVGDAYLQGMIASGQLTPEQAAAIKSMTPRIGG